MSRCTSRLLSPLCCASANQSMVNTLMGCSQIKNAAWGRTCKQHNWNQVVSEQSHLTLFAVQSSLSSGADCVVQSTHKTLSALTQAAMLHIQGERMNAAHISQSLQLLQVGFQAYDNSWLKWHALLKLSPQYSSQKCGVVEITAKCLYTQLAYPFLSCHAVSVAFTSTCSALIH